MDFRNEYRVRPSILRPDYWIAEFREPKLVGIWRRCQSWSEWLSIDEWSASEELAEAICRRHAGEGTKNLGRLP